MEYFNFIKNKQERIWKLINKRWYSRFQSRYDYDLSFNEAAARYPDRNSLYSYMHHYFHHSCPQSIREHRAYFSLEQRGFGEDAFHAMWWLLMREFKPRKCLEIGVYRGQVISLWSLIAKILDFPCEVHGISPFAPIGDSVSTYPNGIDYLHDVMNSFNYFKLQAPILVKALSSGSEAIKHISGIKWDMIYIDGGHDFDTVLADYRLCRNHLAPNGILVLDDASLETPYRPPSFSSAGHPGPSRVVREFAMKDMSFIGAVGHNNIFQMEDEL